MVVSVNERYYSKERHVCQGVFHPIGSFFHVHSQSKSQGENKGWNNPEKTRTVESGLGKETPDDEEYREEEQVTPLEDQIEIQEYLQKGMTFKAI